MDSESQKKYNDFIDTYERLYHLNSSESHNEILNSMIDCLVNKYNISKYLLIKSLLTAIKFNYKSIVLYSIILNQILTKFSIPSSYVLNNFPDLLNNNEFVVTMKFPQWDEFDDIIMYDRIEKFKNIALERDIEKLNMTIPNFSSNSILENCAYFGSVNIFSFIIMNYSPTITAKCLENAIISGNTDIINECLKYQTLFPCCINYAIASHNNTFLQHMLTHDLIDAKDFDYQLVIDSQNLKSVFLLFEKDKKLIVPWCSAFQQTYEIIKNGNLDLTKTVEDNKTILHFAAEFNCLETCKFLISSCKINVNTSSFTQRTPLHYAAVRNSYETSEFLLTKKANVNAKDIFGFTPLHFAARDSSKELVQLFISHGANVEIKNDFGYDALLYSVEQNNEKIAEILINNGANINQEYYTRGTPAFHHANKNYDCNVNGYTVLHKAAQLNYKDIMAFLLSHGANINAVTSLGETALHIAAKYDSKDAVELLIFQGIDVSAKNKDNQTAYQYTILYNSKHIEKNYLLYA
ncbi:hypothetical protein TVAG_070860 [Trichomonas vaginalis G3]|uniref:DUF3447 domain-containing protein n=1 Tax=Trichomonas vaginalis (strain ATCC PRA-98 / G3) TaxID=412133 RepID=A2D7Y9_TRIV3|nr:spectrin binding [Trichomonas vaginalis G3]EAY23422.1 hypothetical protein TVAG_070860 [Trichomonas vaginalis G3]KAI5493835.1 spectrin binding [Trichomonas vaginalis G3]|eukprot:XP_001584408.1 hypothetical protein [Trichomonas vaginalis G3]